MEYKLKAVNQTVIDLDQKQGIIKTYINSFNVIDTWKEVSLPGSFKKTFTENFKKIFWLYNHDWDVMPGITKELYEDGKGAIAVGQFNMKKQKSVDLYNDYLLYAENGRSLEHSIRTQIIKSTIVDDITYISEQKVSEWSSLTRPGANPETEVISLKYSNEDIEMLKKALNLNYSDEKLKQIEEQIKALELKAAESTLNDKPQNEFIKQIDYNKLLTVNFTK